MADRTIGPARRWMEVGSGDDSNNLPENCRAIYVGTSGNIQITDLSGEVVILHSLAAGVVHPICAVKIHATNTTAANIKAVN